MHSPASARTISDFWLAERILGDAVHRAMDLILAAAEQIRIESPPQTHVHYLYSNYTLQMFCAYNSGQKRIKW